VATMYYFNCHFTFAETALSQSWRFVHSFQLTGALREGRINGSLVITNAVAVVLKSFMGEKVHLYKSFLLRDALLSFLLFWPRECNIRTFSPLDNAQIQVLSFIWPPSWASASYRWHRSFHTVLYFDDAVPYNNDALFSMHLRRYYVRFVLPHSF